MGSGLSQYVWHAVTKEAGVILEILLSSFQNNCNYQGRFGDFGKEDLISVVDLQSRGSGRSHPPEAIGIFLRNKNDTNH